MDVQFACPLLALLCISVVWATRLLRAPLRTPLVFELLASGAATVPFAFVVSLVVMRALFELKVPLTWIPVAHDRPFAGLFGGAYLLVFFAVMAVRLRAPKPD